jgi:hypothetical protein
MKFNQEMEPFFSQVMILLGTSDKRYISFRVNDPNKIHRKLYKMLYKQFSGDVPVKIVKDGNMIWVSKR